MTRVADGNWTKVRSQESVNYLRKKGKATGRARQRLVEAHREEFARYLEEEKAALGLGGGR